jgi:large subunit ribosomal protein L5
MTKVANKPATTTRLKDLYFKQYRQELQKELGVGNAFAVPKIEKIVLNIGTGKFSDDKKSVETAINTLRKITGQQPIKTIARKSIAAFKLREGSEIGLKVTLRDKIMYEFLDRFINIILPRFRDFHGVSMKAFDKQGNYSVGLKDQSVFPELSFEETTFLHGLQVIIVIKNSNDVNKTPKTIFKICYQTS